MTDESVRYVIGIDEAGRGPIAGPLALGAVAISLGRSSAPAKAWRAAHTRVLEICPGVRDSKQLTERAREQLFIRCSEIAEVRRAVACVSPAVIDRVGISRATRLAIARALRKLGLPPTECLVLLDGLLTAPRAYRVQETIIHGDAIEPIISLASIIAKVSRDRLLCRLDRRYPHYGFEQHKGYGTRAHYRAIAEHGLCPIHRRSFLLSLVQDYR